MDHIRVGVVGANAERSWAKDSHIPAIRQLPALSLSDVATRSDESARAAAEAFGAAHWFADAQALCRSDTVDLVAVCVKVPEHEAIIRAALDAGKHVYCEWPLGRSVEEAERLADMARPAGLHHAIGLQGSAAPATRRAREVIASGRIGHLRSARIVSTTAGYAAALPSAFAYLNDPANGANLTTILGGHTLDLAEQLLGKVITLDALSAIQHPTVRLIDTGTTIARTTPDQLFILSHHEGGCVASIEVGGDRPGVTPFTCEIIGSNGTLCLSGGHPHGFQAGELLPNVDEQAEPIAPPLANGGLHGAATNVAQVYAALASDIRKGTWTVSDFAMAARLTRLITGITQASESGSRFTA